MVYLKDQSKMECLILVTVLDLAMIMFVIKVVNMMLIVVAGLLDELLK